MDASICAEAPFTNGQLVPEQPDSAAFQRKPAASVLTEARRDLNAEFKSWLKVVEELRIEPYFAWVPREENTRADGLSKLIPLEWGLSAEARASMTSNFPSHEWTLPGLNQIGNVLLEARDKGADLLLVHPTWPGAAWWNLVQAYGVRRVDLPTADRTLVSSKKGRPGPPRWRMQATLIHFA